jgi:nucleolar complex protein 2
MGGQNKKATKKFEKNHLKDTIERRKGFAKIKQRQQIKAKKKARHASDYAKVPDEDEEKEVPKANGRPSKAVTELKDMTVDEFFQGGFEVPELTKKAKKLALAKESQKDKKRKRGTVEEEDEDSDSSAASSSSELAHVPMDDLDSDDESQDGLEGHKEDLEALKEKDPEFYKYLKDNDAELLEFEENAEFPTLSSDDSEEERPKKKKKQTQSVQEEEKDSTDVTIPMVEKWRKAMAEQKSLRAMREAVLAFRATASVNDEDRKEFKYTISTPEVYHQLLLVSLKHVPEVLAHHLPVKELPSGRIRFSTDNKKFRTLTPLLKSHATAIHHLLEGLSDPSTIKLTLSSTLPLLPYLLSFKKVLKNLVKAVISIWSLPSSAESTRVHAFLLIRRLALISDTSLREAVLKSTYQGLIRGTRSTTIHTLPGINLMKNSAAELWSLDPSLAYTTGFTYIRQLAIHLRAAITHPTKESHKTIYNWQYVHSLDFWSRVLSTQCSPSTNTTLKKPSDSPLHPLIYPLVQITIGALRLIPSPIYFPLRFHLTRSLLRLSLTTQTYIPLAPCLLEVLSSPELKKAPKASTLRPLDFATTLRAPSTYLKTRVYQTGLGEQVAELLAEFFGIWCKNIAFPELVIPPTVLLKRWLKEVSPHQHTHNPKQSRNGKQDKGNRNAKFCSAVVLLVQKLDANAKFVAEKRRTVDFAPSNREGVENFLKDVRWEDTPLGAFVTGQRKIREEKENVLGEAREKEKVEERRAREAERGEDEMEGVEIDEGSDDEVDEIRTADEDEDEDGSVD